MALRQVHDLSDSHDEFVTCLAQGLSLATAAQLAGGQSGNARAMMLHLEPVIRAYAGNLAEWVRWMDAGYPRDQNAPPPRVEAPTLRLIQGGAAD
jgi:hypothetical protein